MSKPLLQVSVFSDYICPFCYIGSERLLRLQDRYDLRINWCLVQIHPETPPEGMPIEALHYSKEKWQQMMRALDEMAKAEGLHFAKRRITTNSYQAQLLAEAAKSQGLEIFYPLHQALFRAFFSEDLNIADESVLKDIAKKVGLASDFAEKAWQSVALAEKLQEYQKMSVRYQIAGVPTYFFGKHKIFGASAIETLQEAAKHLVEVREKALAEEE